MDDSKYRIKNKVASVPNLVIKKKVSIQKIEQMLNSWKGHADQADTANFYKYLLDRFEYLEMKTMGEKNKFQIESNLILI